MAENKLADMSIAQKSDISVDTSKAILHNCSVIRRMLIFSINTAKENIK